MSTEPLPQDTTALAELSNEVQVLLYLSLMESQYLARLADLPEGPPPAIITAHPTLGTLEPTKFARPASVDAGNLMGIYQVVNSGADINERMAELAKRVLPILRHFPVSLSDRLFIGSITGDNRSPGAGPSLALEGLWRFAHELPPSRDVVEANRHRLATLRGVFERLTNALTGLSEDLKRKLHPPEVRDRVTVDIEAHRVTVDGSSYDLNTREQALILDQLAKANGRPLSGPEIASGAGLRKGLMVSRVVTQIRSLHPALDRLIPPPQKTKNKFCICLPPL